MLHNHPHRITNRGNRLGVSEGLVRLTDRLLAASFILALAAFGYLGWFSRYMADDFSTARLVDKYGLLGAQRAWYFGWTGRFSFTFVASLLGLIGPITPRIVPAFLLTLWFVATVWAIRQIHWVTARTSWARAVLFAGLIIFATLETAPNMVQSLYWQAGALTYIAPLVLLSLFVGLLSRLASGPDRRLSQSFYLSCAGILTFAAGGFSDVYVLLQSYGLILALLSLQFSQPSRLKPEVKPYLIVGLLGSLLALTVVGIAPGNSIRRSYFPDHLGVFHTLQLTIAYSLRFVAKLLLTHSTAVAVLLALPFLSVLRDHSCHVSRLWDRRLCIRLLILVPLTVFTLIACCTAPSFFLTSVMLPERSRIILGLIFVCGAVVWSRAAGELLCATLLRISHNKLRIVCVGSTVLLISMSIYPLASFVSTLGKREPARAFAADWDRQHKEIRAERETGLTNVEVEQIGDFQFRLGKGNSDLHLRTDPSFWINREIAKYYGLTSLRARQNVPISH